MWVLSLSGEDPLKKEMAPAFLPGKSHAQRGLPGYSPRGGKESDTAEQQHTQDQQPRKLGGEEWTMVSGVQTKKMIWLLLYTHNSQTGHLLNPVSNTLFVNVLLPGFLLNFWIHYSQIAAICLQSKIFFPLPYPFEIHQTCTNYLVIIILHLNNLPTTTIQQFLLS